MNENEEEVRKKIIEILRKYARNHALLEKATAKTRIIGDLNVSSARFIDVILTFEDVFKIEIGDDEINQVATIGEAAALIQRKLAKG